MRRTCTLATAAALLATPAAATSVDQLFLFGASLLDTGNVLAATGGLFPPPPFNDGRFTGGRNVADFLAEDFGLTPGVDLINFAFGAARAVTDLTDLVVDFGEQQAQFAPVAGTVGPDAWAVTSFGGNDINAVVQDAAIANPFDPMAAEDAAALAARDAADAFAAQLGLFGPDLFTGIVVPTVGDLSRVPRYTEPNSLGIGPFGPLAPLASSATSAFNDQLLGNLVGLQGLGYNVVVADVAPVFEAIVDDPASIGATAGSCGTLDAIALGLPFYDFSSGVCDETDIAGITALFWDDLHPNEAGQRVFASVVTEAIQGPAVIPLPLPAAGLAGALAALAALRGVGPASRRLMRS